MKPEGAEAPDLLFYDGHCGLCHRAVLFALKRDRDGSRFSFSPLQGESFLEKVPEAQRTALPDSMVLLSPDGRLHLRSDAALRLGARIGGAWGFLAALGRLVPRPLRDLVYDGVAKVRKRIFGAPEDACPVIPKELRERFLP